MTRNIIKFIAGMTAALVFITSACDKSPDSKPAQSDSTKSSAQLPGNLFLAAPPVSAINVADCKNSAKEGDAVVVRGRIGGRKEPFVDGRAIFTLADVSMPACSDVSGDNCPTPWDYCCEPSDKIAAQTVTVQIVDPSDAVLKTDVKNVSGLSPLAKIVVEGRVCKKQGQSMTIDAKAIYVEKS